MTPRLRNPNSGSVTEPRYCCDNGKVFIDGEYFEDHRYGDSPRDSLTRWHAARALTAEATKLASADAAKAKALRAKGSQNAELQRCVPLAETLTALKGEQARLKAELAKQERRAAGKGIRFGGGLKVFSKHPQRSA